MKQWTESQCISMALLGVFKVMLGVVMISLLGHPADGRVDRASFSFLALVFVAVGIWYIGLAHWHWMRDQPGGKGSAHPLE